MVMPPAAANARRTATWRPLLLAGVSVLSLVVALGLLFAILTIKRDQPKKEAISQVAAKQTIAVEPAPASHVPQQEPPTVTAVAPPAIEPAKESAPEPSVAPESPAPKPAKKPKGKGKTKPKAKAKEPESKPAPPEPTPPAPMPPSKVKLKRSEVEALIKALTAAREAISEHNFGAADVQISKAQSLAELPKHHEAVIRLKEICEYVKQFRLALIAAVREMQPGQMFQVGASTQVTFVAGSADRVTVRAAGSNKTYSFNDMPSGLAMAIADFKLPVDEPMSRVIKGAYLATHKRGTSETQDRAQTLWSEAQAAGVSIVHLMPFFGEEYEAFLKDVD